MRWPEQWNSETTDRGWHWFRRATILNGAQRSATGLGAGWRVSDVIGRTARILTAQNSAEPWVTTSGRTSSPRAKVAAPAGFGA